MKKIREEELWAKLYDNVPCGIGVFEANEENRFLYLNDAFFKMVGYTKEDYENSGKQFLEYFIYDPDKKMFGREVLKKAKNGLPINVTFRYVRKEEQSRKRFAWIHLNATKIRDNADKPIYYAVMTPPPQENMLYRSIVDDSLTAAMVMDKKTVKYFLPIMLFGF